MPPRFLRKFLEGFFLKIFYALLEKFLQSVVPQFIYIFLYNPFISFLSSSFMYLFRKPSMDSFRNWKVLFRFHCNSFKNLLRIPWRNSFRNSFWRSSDLAFKNFFGKSTTDFVSENYFRILLEILSGILLEIFAEFPQKIPPEIITAKISSKFSLNNLSSVLTRIVTLITLGFTEIL